MLQLLSNDIIIILKFMAFVTFTKKNVACCLSSERQMHQFYGPYCMEMDALRGNSYSGTVSCSMETDSLYFSLVRCRLSLSVCFIWKDRK